MRALEEWGDHRRKRLGLYFRCQDRDCGSAIGVSGASGGFMGGESPDMLRWMMIVIVINSETLAVTAD